MTTDRDTRERSVPNGGRFELDARGLRAGPGGIAKATTTRANTSIGTAIAARSQLTSRTAGDLMDLTNGTTPTQMTPARMATVAKVDTCDVK